MKHTERNLLDVILTLFDSGGEGPSDGGEASPSHTPGKVNLPQETVAYGKQPTPTSSPQDGGGELPRAEDASQPQVRRAKFDELIKGEFKDLYDARVQSIVKDRLGDVKQMKAKLASVSPVLELLAQRYGLDTEDPDALLEAVEQDDAYWEQAADEVGMTVEQYRAMQKLERENQRLRQVQEVTLREEAVTRKVQEWEEQGRALQETYPDFDLQGECRNPQFVSLLRNGVDVKTAYEVLHMDEIKHGVAAGAAKAAERAVTATIQAKGMRPTENGAVGQGGILVKDDVTKLTRADRAEIIRRVARGEKIAF